MIFLENIKILRKKKGISQKMMADLLKISQPAYQKIECGENQLSLERFLKICEILEIDSYNKVLPAINAEPVEEVNRVLINGNYAFSSIHGSSRQIVALIDDLKDKIGRNKLFGNKIKEELEFIASYAELIKEQTRRSKNDYSNTIELMKELD